MRSSCLSVTGGVLDRGATTLQHDISRRRVALVMFEHDEVIRVVSVAAIAASLYVTSRGISKVDSIRRRLQTRRWLKMRHVPMDQLRDVGVRYGYGRASIRASAWLVLLDNTLLPRETVRKDRENRKSRSNRRSERKRGSDDDVIVADVERSMCHFDATVSVSSEEREKLRRELLDILRKACKPSNIHYYQGFHDVVSVVMLTCGVKTGQDIAERLAKTRLRDFMSEDMASSLETLELMYLLLRRVDEELHKFLCTSGVNPLFALSWTLTWFAHDISSLAVVERIFDFLLASHSFAIVYLNVALLCYAREGILSVRPCEMASVYQFLQTLPSRVLALSVDCVVARASALLESQPPQTLLAYVSSTSPGTSFASFKSPIKRCQTFSRLLENLRLKVQDDAERALLLVVVPWVLIFPLCVVLVGGASG